MTLDVSGRPVTFTLGAYRSADYERFVEEARAILEAMRIGSPP